MQLSQQQAFQVIRHIEENAGRLIATSSRPDAHAENAIERLQGLSIALAYAEVPDMEARDIMLGIAESQKRLTNKLTERAA